jgi:homocysteine S-methyltransferase
MFPGNNFINPFALSRRINRPLILDGAMGSMLQQSGIKSRGSMWMSLANIKQPEIVCQIHKNYIKAGADIITTNTFRTNPAAVENYDKRLNCEKLVKDSVKLALEASNNLPVFIAGSNAPAEDCYQVERKLSLKELELNHYKHIDYLMESGCHFILNETQSHFDEIKIICKYCLKNNIPYLISLFVDENLKILSGEELDDVVKFILEYKPLAVGINCILQETFMKFHNKAKLNFFWGAYLNCGSGDFTDDNIKCGISPSSYKETIKNILPKSPSFIGACCGSTPKHIMEIKKLLDGTIKN